MGIHLCACAKLCLYDARRRRGPASVGTVILGNERACGLEAIHFIAAAKSSPSSLDFADECFTRPPRPIFCGPTALRDRSRCVGQAYFICSCPTLRISSFSPARAGSISLSPAPAQPGGVATCGVPAAPAPSCGTVGNLTDPGARVAQPTQPAAARAFSSAAACDAPGNAQSTALVDPRAASPIVPPKAPPNYVRRPPDAGSGHLFPKRHCRVHVCRRSA
jgi:hypothetical protein